MENLGDDGFFLKTQADEDTCLQAEDILEFTILDGESDNPVLALQILRDSYPLKICGQWGQVSGSGDSLLCELEGKKNQQALRNEAAFLASCLGSNHNLRSEKTWEKTSYDVFRFKLKENTAPP